MPLILPVKLTLDVTKSLEKNAEHYYELSKKAKRKIDSVKRIIAETEQKLEKLDAHEQKKQEKVPQRKRQWYEKFRWFITSDGFLVLGGRDATTNEIVIKKHMDDKDLVFHTDMAGSPFFVLKTEGKEPTAASLQECADATCTFSRAWKLNMGAQSVFYVHPDQISKQANPGEYLTKGAFMIRGKTNYIDNNVNCAIGAAEDGAIMCGPVEAIKTHCAKAVVVRQGQLKPSDAAKKIQKRIGGMIDDIIRALPSGNFELAQ